MALAITSLIGASAGLRAVHERVRGIDRTAHRSEGLVRRVVVAGLPLMVWVPALLLLWRRQAHPALVGVVLVGFVVLLAAAAPLLLTAALPTRRPEPAVRERLAHLATEHGVRLRRVRVIETGDDPAADAALAGFGPGPKYFFVTDRPARGRGRRTGRGPGPRVGAPQGAPYRDQDRGTLRRARGDRK